MEMRQNMDPVVEQRRFGMFDHLLTTVFRRPIDTALFWLTVFTLYWSGIIFVPNPRLSAANFIEAMTNAAPLWLWIVVWACIDIALVACLVTALPRVQYVTLLASVFIWFYTAFILLAWPEFSAWGGQTLIYFAMAVWAFGRSSPESWWRTMAWVASCLRRRGDGC